MSTVIYYFSATGNSMTTAKMLAAELGDCTVQSIVSLKNMPEIPVNADAVGFVFPIYYSDMPHLMRQIIGRMHFEGSPYIFSVCTCRGHFGNIAQRLNTLLQTRGQVLSFSCHIPMPGNSRLSTPEQNIAMLAAQKERVHQAAQELQKRPVENYETEVPPPHSPVHDASNMRGMTVEDHCIGCGICQQVCPMGNIHLKDNHPVIGENCISCLACFHWCPQEAIWMSKAEEALQRRFKYRHPDVTVSDIINQKQQ